MKLLLASLLALCSASPGIVTQNVHLPDSQSPAVYSGTIHKSPTTPSEVRIELDGRDIGGICVQDMSGSPSHSEFHQTQALRIIVGQLSIDQQGDPVDVTLDLAGNGSDCQDWNAPFNVALSLTDPTTLAIFTGRGNLSVRVEWDVSPSFVGNGNHSDEETNSFSGRLNFIYLP